MTTKPKKPKKPKPPTKPKKPLTPPPKRPPPKPTTPPPSKPNPTPSPSPAPVNPNIPPSAAGGVSPWWKALGIGAGLYGAGDLLNYFNPNKKTGPSPMRPSGGAMNPDVRVTPSQPVTPTPQGGDEQGMGGNQITPMQVKENLKNYPNSSGYPWSTLKGNQVIDASGRQRQYTGSYLNETDNMGRVIGQRDMGMDPDGPIAVKQAQYFNERGMRTAFQQDNDIGAQLADRNSPMFRAMDRASGGKFTDFRLGNEESDASYDAMVKQRQDESMLRRQGGVPHPQSQAGIARQAQYQAQRQGPRQMTQEQKDMYSGYIRSLSEEDRRKQFASGQLYGPE